MEETTTTTFLDRLMENFPKREATLQQSMTMEGETKYVHVTFDVDEHPQSVELMHITDVQYGAKSFKADRFEEYVKWILSNPHRFVLLGGDIIDAATLISKGSAYDNTTEPMYQVQEVAELLKPLAGRILGYVGGNHERRTIATYGDSGYQIASLLKVPYSRGVQIFDIHYGEHTPFKVSMHHGRGAAQSKGGKMNMLHSFMRQGDSQLYLVGHLHDVVMTMDWRQQRENGQIVLKKIAGAMSSSFQAYWNTYAEVFMLSPSDTVMARAVLDVDGGWELTLR